VKGFNMQERSGSARTVAIVQARLGSVRYPGKVLEDLDGRPALEVLVTRLRRATTIDEVVLAVPDGASDDALERFAARVGVRCIRGSEHDVLARYHVAALETKADVVVRITGDCPLIDPGLVDRIVGPVRDGSADWSSTGETFPDGLDVQATTMAALAAAVTHVTDTSDREHVFPWILRAHDLHGVVIEHDVNLGSVRVTFDEQTDLEVIRAVLASVPEERIDLAELGRLWIERPELFDANRHLVRNEGAVLGTGQKLWRHALERIPGGSMLLSKRAEMILPGSWPAYFDRASGCDVWDLDGQHYVDVGLMGVGTNILGYAHPKVDEAVRRVVEKGALSTLNAPEEVALADRLCELHPWAEMARFTRSGGEACAVAVRIARAASGKDAVAFCGYHGWHDWYLSANLADDAALDGHLLPGLEPAGVPRVLKGTSRPFAYNDIDALKEILSAGDVGTIIMEVERTIPPKPGFLDGVRDLATQHGAVLIFDDCTSGFRQVLGGHHLVHGVAPDIAILGKTLGNGFAVNAVIGRRSAMEAARRTFISSTFWTERIGAAAGLAAIDAMREEDAPARVHAIGLAVSQHWRSLAADTGLELTIAGLPALSTFSVPGRDAATIRTYVIHHLLKQGFLAANAIYASIAHTEDVVGPYLEALAGAMAVIAKRSDEELVASLPNGASRTGFGRLT
jgi:glutamate-1-semialdehyde 2,1-aminomutase